MKLAERITQGSVSVARCNHGMGKLIVESDETQIARTVNAKASTKDDDEEIANAELISEAFTVHSETGLSPKEMQGLLRQIHAHIQLMHVNASDEYLAKRYPYYNQLISALSPAVTEGKN